jgi:hypothetical protein
MLTYIRLDKRADALEPMTFAPVLLIPEASLALSFRNVFFIEEAVISDSVALFLDIFVLRPPATTGN